MIKNQFYIFIIGLAFFSFFSYNYYNLLPANAIFELLVLSAFFFVAKRMQVKAWVVFATCTFYIIYTLSISLINNVHIQDYFLAYKTFVYIAILCFFSGKELFEKTALIKLYHIVLALFILKYVLWLLIATFERPGVFTENNFELMLLLFFSLSVYSAVGKLSRVELVTLVAIVFLSGSRSGVLALFVMLCILYIKSFDWRTILKIGLLSFVGVGVGLIFISRLSGGGIESIDRFVFLQGFVIAVMDWGLLDYLTGSPPLTALPDVVCERLVFYKTMFSAADPSRCYSVILHSYIIRVLFDHGVLGLIFIFGSIWTLIKISGISNRVNFAACSILFFNGLSVSALNSVYAMIGLIILLTATAKRELVGKTAIEK